MREKVDEPKLCCVLLGASVGLMGYHCTKLHLDVRAFV